MFFDKFDEERLQHLIALLNNDTFGQVFITDTHVDRIIELCHQFDGECRIFRIDNSTIQQL